MKKHLALSAAFIAIVLMASSAIAQDTTTPAATTPATTTAKAKKAKSGGASANKAEADLANLTKTLTLTDAQQAQIKPILVDEASNIHGGKKAAGASADDSKAKNKVARDNANKQIRALLTPDQQKLFDAAPKKSGSGAGKKSAPAAAPGA